MNALPTASSIEAAFRPAFNEISRRSDVARSFPEDEGPTNFTRSGDTSPFPFDIPDQDYILISMGTAVLAPRPMELSRPSVRIYGAFPTKEDARDHAGIVKEIDPTCSLVVVKRDKWILFPQTEAARDNQEENERICDTRLIKHTEDMRRADIQFKSDVDSKVERPAPLMTQTKTDKEEQEQVEEAEALIYKPPRRLRAGAEVRGQGVVAMCVLPDEKGECLVRILGCFENTTEANTWVRNVGSRHVTDVDILIAPTCEWLYPNCPALANGKKQYRIDELQRIMDAADQNPEAVRSYKDWKREQQERSDAVDAEIKEENNLSSMKEIPLDSSVV